MILVLYHKNYNVYLFTVLSLLLWTCLVQNAMLGILMLALYGHLFHHFEMHIWVSLNEKHVFRIL